MNGRKLRALQVRMIWASVVAVLLLMGLAAYIARQAFALNTIMTDFKEHLVPSAKAVNALQIDTLDCRIAEKRFVFTAGGQAAQRWATEMAACKNKVHDSINGPGFQNACPEEEMKLRKDFLAAWEKYLAASGKIAMLLAQEQFGEARKLLLGVSQQYFEEAGQPLLYLSELHSRLISDASREKDAIQVRVEGGAAAFLFLLTLVTLLLFIGIGHLKKRPPATAAPQNDARRLGRDVIAMRAQMIQLWAAAHVAEILAVAVVRTGGMHAEAEAEHGRVTAGTERILRNGYGGYS